VALLGAALSCAQALATVKICSPSWGYPDNPDPTEVRVPCTEGTAEPGPPGTMQERLTAGVIGNPLASYPYDDYVGPPEFGQRRCKYVLSTDPTKPRGVKPEVINALRARVANMIGYYYDGYLIEYIDPIDVTSSGTKVGNPNHPGFCKINSAGIPVPACDIGTKNSVANDDPAVPGGKIEFNKTTKVDNALLPANFPAPPAGITRPAVACHEKVPPAGANATQCFTLNPPPDYFPWNGALPPRGSRTKYLTSTKAGCSAEMVALGNDAIYDIQDSAYIYNPNNNNAWDTGRMLAAKSFKLLLVDPTYTMPPPDCTPPLPPPTSNVNLTQWLVRMYDCYMAKNPEYCAFSASGVNMSTCGKELAWKRGVRIPIWKKAFEEIRKEIDIDGKLKLTDFEGTRPCAEMANSLRTMIMGCPADAQKPLDDSAGQSASTPENGRPGILQAEYWVRRQYAPMMSKMVKNDGGGDQSMEEGCLGSEVENVAEAQARLQQAVGSADLNALTEEKKRVSMAVCNLAFARRQMQQVFTKLAFCELRVRSKKAFYEGVVRGDKFLEYLKERVVKPCAEFAKDKYSLILPSCHKSCVIGHFYDCYKNGRYGGNSAYRAPPIHLANRYFVRGLEPGYTQAPARAPSTNPNLQTPWTGANYVDDALDDLFTQHGPHNTPGLNKLLKANGQPFGVHEIPDCSTAWDPAIHSGTAPSAAGNSIISYSLWRAARRRKARAARRARGRWMKLLSAALAVAVVLGLGCDPDIPDEWLDQPCCVTDASGARSVQVVHCNIIDGQAQPQCTGYPPFEQCESETCEDAIEIPDDPAIEDEEIVDQDIANVDDLNMGGEGDSAIISQEDIKPAKKSLEGGGMAKAGELNGKKLEARKVTIKGLPKVGPSSSLVRSSSGAASGNTTPGAGGAGGGNVNISLGGGAASAGGSKLGGGSGDGSMGSGDQVAVGTAKKGAGAGSGSIQGSAGFDDLSAGTGGGGGSGDLDSQSGMGDVEGGGSELEFEEYLKKGGKLSLFEVISRRYAAWSVEFK
jgi:hypothetical protein